MKKHLLTIVAGMLAGIVLLQGQTVEKTSSGIKIPGTVVTEIQVYSPTIVRVVKYPEHTTLQKQSLSVVLKPEKTDFKVRENKASVILQTRNLVVEYSRVSGTLRFLNAKQEVLICEKEASRFKPVSDLGTATFAVGQKFQLDPDESVYGLGQQQQGKMSQRNVKLNMIQGNTDDYVPFFVSTKGYGLFWDNYSPTTYTDNSEGTDFLSEIGDCVDYYVMNGGSMDGAIAGMRKLTGDAPLFPLWTYGFWQSKERYKSQNELVSVVKKYRELQVPLDGIIQDWQYWGNNYLWNSMDFLNIEFPQPNKMIEDIHAMNAHLIISIWASFGPHTLQYREMNDKGMLLDFQTWPQSGVEFWPPDMNFPSGVKPYDPYNPEARDIYWKYLNKGLFSRGIDGWWMDSTEPDHLSFKSSDLDQKTYLGSFRKVRNAFPLQTVGGVYDHQRKTTDAKRVFILTRSAFAGQQRYGANTWSGDVNSSWQTLRNQIPAGLNFSMSAIPYWNSDIGGFFAGSYNRVWGDGSGALNPLYQELYVRWLQFGALTPMMRSHGTEVPREIYNFGKKGEPVYDAIDKAIRLRYSLLPYIYSTAWTVTSRQGTFMRPLVMDFPKDPESAETGNEYLFGKSLLVAPVVHAQYTPETVVKTDEQTGWNKTKNADGTPKPAVDFTKESTTTVYLPQGANWYDFWTLEMLTGGQEYKRTTSLDRIPLFVRAGSILPVGPDVQYAEEKKWDQLGIRIYPGANADFVLYEDEKDNYNYEKGLYSTVTFRWDNAARRLTVEPRKGSFPGMLTTRTFEVSLTGGATKTIRYDGKKLVVTF